MTWHSKLNMTCDFVEASRVLEVLCEGVADVLTDTLIGIYLCGSLVTGDFDPDVSDIDLVVVTTRDLDDSRFNALHQHHGKVVSRFPHWHDRLELVYLSQVALKTVRDKTHRIAVISPGESFHRVEAGADWLVTWYPLREHGVALLGPPIQTLMDAIDRADYLAAVQAHIETYRLRVLREDSKASLSYIVLTTARGLHTVLTGEPTSKIRAAAWAMQTYPRWTPLIEMALQWRENPDADSLSVGAIRPQAQALVIDLLDKIPN